MTQHPIALITPPEGYADWLDELKHRINSAQQRAALAVNRELVLLYWEMGRDILVRQSGQGWGSKVIDRLAHDLRLAFPTPRASRRETSSTCVPSPTPGRTRHLCKRCLHNYRGITN